MTRRAIRWIDPLRSGDLQMALTGVCAAAGLAGAACGRFLPEAPAWKAGLYVTSYLAGGFGPTRDLVRSLLARQLDVNLLMIAAAAGSAAIGHWGEGAILLFLFSLSGALERYAMERTARSIGSLIELRPDEATVIRGDGEVRVRVEEIAVGELVRAHPGERFAVDGMVVEGATSADEATITGESMPVEKAPGDSVYAGTVNLVGAPVVRVTKLAADTTLSRIVRSVQEARRERTTTERMVDRWQRPYVVAVFAGSALATVIPLLFLHHGFREAFYHGMVLLVAASPCAVVIAAPAATLSAIAHAAHHGVLFKGGAHLERLSEVTALALDKTGTITEGKSRVVAVASAGCATPEDALLRMAAAVEQRSEHHTARAVVIEAVQRGASLPPVHEFESHSGLGAHGHVEGLWVGVGREALFTGHQVPIPEAAIAAAERLRAAGRSALLVIARRSVDGDGTPAAPEADGLVACGAIGVADTLRPEARAAIQACRRLGIRHVAMLTGDHAAVARAIGAEVNVDEVLPDLLPDDKVRAVRQLLTRWRALAMVGDGVNDAPALATATVGVAMGGAGTDVALDTADVVLMRDNLEGIPFAIWLSRRTQRVTMQSLSLAFGVIGVLVLSTLTGILPLWLAVVCHEGSTLLVVANGVRLLGIRHPDFEVR